MLEKIYGSSLIIERYHLFTNVMKDPLMQKFFFFFFTYEQSLHIETICEKHFATRRCL